MSYSSSFGWGPAYTPAIIRRLLFITGLTSLISALFDPLFTRTLQVPGLQYWLSLSWDGLHHYAFWQPLSYLFVASMGWEGIDLGFLISLAFTLYFIWALGSDLVEMVGSSSFLRFYLSSGLIGGLSALAMMSITGNYQTIAGPQTTLLALLTVWTLRYPERDILIFLLFKIPAKWLATGIIGGLSLIYLSRLNLVGLTTCLAPVLFAYTYAVAAWGLHGPSPWTHAIDQWIDRMTRRAKRTWGVPANNAAKILDISTGEPVLSDDLFVDAMLAKIARNGENSLTYSERKRLDEISVKKSKQGAKMGK